MFFVLRIFFIVFITLHGCFLHAQNIVPNGNLEDVNICTELHAPCSPSAWFTVKKYAPGGYYHQFPDKAASGKQYFDLFVVMREPARQYWQTRLLCNLVPGQTYQASVKLSAASIGPNLNDIGFYFTNNFIYSGNDTLLQPPDYLNFLDAEVKNLKYNWFQITKEFTASSSESCLIIGNFNPEANMAILAKRRIGNLINIMIDDIVIAPLNKSVCTDYKQRKDSLYAIKKRHSGDTVYTQVKTVSDTAPVIKKQIDPVIIPPRKTDTLQLSNVLFEFDRYELIHPDTIEAFRQLFLNPSIKKIQVIGYTDDAGSEAYNTRLSEKRAREIARLIITRFKIDTAIIQSEGRGISSYYPDKGKNRRVDIYLYY